MNASPLRCARQFLSAALLALAMPVLAAPCAGFTDVDTSSPFCSAVEWMKNRAITLGCTVSQYCPSGSVTRLEMAAFMSRMGGFLPPTIVDSNGKAFATTQYDSSSGGWGGIALLRYSGNVANLRMVKNGGSIDYYAETLYFELPNCDFSGNVYIHYGPSLAPQWAAVVFGADVGGVPGPRWLFVSQPFATPPSTAALSRYSFGGCTNASLLGPYLPATLVGDISIVWKAPFTIQ